ncbi:MAG: hypothetical protein ACI3ZK_07300 [Candidatus Cryptobacteroides sp.]
MGELIRNIFDVIRLAGPFNTFLFLVGLFLIIYCAVYCIKDDFGLTDKESKEDSPTTYVFEIEDLSKKS